jgi:hypothetical protein
MAFGCVSVIETGWDGRVVSVTSWSKLVLHTGTIWREIYVLGLSSMLGYGVTVGIFRRVAVEANTPFLKGTDMVGQHRTTLDTHPTTLWSPGARRRGESRIQSHHVPISRRSPA